MLDIHHHAENGAPAVAGDFSPSLLDHGSSQADRQPTVFVVDDDPNVRRTLETLIRLLGFRAIGFADGQSFLDRFRIADPGCVLLDLQMPELDGLQVQARLCELPYTLPVIMISGAAEIALAVQAMKLGALDFLKKPFTRERIEQTVTAAIELDRQLRSQWRHRSDVQERLSQLNEKEHLVLELLADGLLNKQIAARLEVTTRTIESRRASIYRKLAVASLGELMQIVHLASKRHIHHGSHPSPGPPHRRRFSA